MASNYMENGIIKVCKSDCQNIAFTADVKGKKRTFCCEKGFNQSLVDFQNYLKPKHRRIQLAQKYEFSEKELKKAYETIKAHENRIRILTSLLEKYDTSPPTDAGISMEQELF